MINYTRKNGLLSARTARRRICALARLIIVFGALPVHAATPPVERDIPKVRSQVFDIGYRVDEAAQPLETVQLWYTLDRGQSWRHYGRDEDAQSPMLFHARDEGLCGFYFVVTNSAGASGEPPGPDTDPQYWAMVDYTPPIVQLHSTDQDSDSLIVPTLQIRWTAIDSHLPTRPVGLWYRSVPAGQWTMIVRDIANTGRYDWRVPDNVTGSIVVRITVRDQGANLVHAVGQATELLRLSEQNVRSFGSSGERSAPKAAPKLDAASQSRVDALTARGVWHAERGEHRLAVARFRDALKLNPSNTEAMLGLATGLYRLGDHAPSIEAYELLLSGEPRHRTALEQLARALVARKDYPAAATRLQTLVRHDPYDVMSWLELGDVSMYQGDQMMAAEHYRRAAILDPKATDVVSMAKIRLANLRGVAERARKLAEGS